MKPRDLWSAAWLLFALVGVTWSSVRAGATALVQTSKPQLAAASGTRLLASGEAAVVDADGFAVPRRHYQRIASGSTTADQLLLALVEPERIDALTLYGREHSSEPYLYGERFPITGLHQLEDLLARRVDLLVLHKVGGQAPLSRTRESGIQVFNLGEMRGLQTLIPNIHALAALLGDPARGRRHAEQLVRRMRMVAADIPASRRKRAIYVSAYANQLFGGASGTSYHDVLTHAGLIDAADGTHSGFLQYDPEQIVQLDPELVVVNRGTEQALCRVAGLARVRACQNGGAGIIGLPPELLSDPGPHMLEAAEALRDAVYGPPR